jgi:hypothetical protein
MKSAIAKATNAQGHRPHKPTAQKADFVGKQILGLLIYGQPNKCKNI